MNDKSEEKIVHPYKNLRDEFAMAALTGLLAMGGLKSFEQEVESSFKYADMCMLQRQKGGTI